MDNIQKALKIIGVKEATGHIQYPIPSMVHWRQAAALSAFYRMNAQLCASDFCDLLTTPERKTTCDPLQHVHAQTSYPRRKNKLIVE